MKALGRGRRNKRILENTFSPTTYQTKTISFQRTNLLNRREHA